jgi:hypothetical protein
MFGDKTNSERHQLKETVDHTSNKFETGATNKFLVKAPDVGKVVYDQMAVGFVMFLFKIKTIRIEHDGTGIGAGWYLDSVEIRHVSRNETYR